MSNNKKKDGIGIANMIFDKKKRRSSVQKNSGGEDDSEEARDIFPPLPDLERTASIGPPVPLTPVRWSPTYLLKKKKPKNLKPKKNESIKPKRKPQTQLKDIFGIQVGDVSKYFAPVHAKSTAEIELIKTAIEKNQYFYNNSELTINELMSLVEAFEPFEAPKDTNIITQGEAGDYFYIVAEGEVAFFVDTVEVGKGEKGTSFGELALIHTSPRAATVKASTNPITKLFRVDQKTFRAILQKQLAVTEELKLSIIKSVDLFKEIQLSDIKRLGQTMTPRAFGPGDSLVTSGKGTGRDIFCIIQDGEVEVLDDNSTTTTDNKKDDNGAATRSPSIGIIKKAGDYFGERGLVMSEEGRRSIIGRTKGIAFMIDKGTFDKVLGNFSYLVARSHYRQILEGLEMWKHLELSTLELDSLATLITSETYEEGKRIFGDSKGTEASLYFLKEGKVQLTGDHTNANGYIKPGEVFGEDQLLLDVNYSGVPDVTVPSIIYPRYSAIAQEKCVCGVLSLLDCRSIFDTSKLLDPSNPLQFEGDNDDNATTASNNTADTASSEFIAPPMTTMKRETTQQWLASNSIKELREKIQNFTVLEDLKHVSFLGEGAFGEVWLVNVELGTMKHEFALKIQQKGKKSRNAAIKREIDVLAKMDHPYICKLVNSYEDVSSLQILMGLVHGGELFDIIHHQGDDGLWYSGISEKDAKFYAMLVTDTLNYIHRKHYVHRDVKPENILIDQDGYPVLVDFGFAKFVPDKTYTLCGTPNYLSPEIVMNRGHNSAADHWALGVVIYEMLAGENPFLKDGMDQMTLFGTICKKEFRPLQDHISDSAYWLVDELLVKKPSERLGSLAGGGKDILAMEWFDDIHLGELRTKRYTAPNVPNLSTMDTLVEEGSSTSLLD